MSFATLLLFLASMGTLGFAGIACAVVLGIIVLREPVSFQLLAGFALAAVGILLIATR